MDNVLIYYGIRGIMFSNSNRYFVVFLIAIGLVVLLFISIFNGGTKQPKSNEFTSTTITKLSTADSAVSMSIEGSVTAPVNHNKVVVKVNKSDAEIDVYQGYDNKIINTKSYPNTVNSYETFLRSIYFAGFTQGQYNASLANPAGRCSMGSTYTYNIYLNGSTVQSYWETDCGGVSKTFKGSSSVVQSLFRQQIPDYNSISSNLNL